MDLISILTIVVVALYLGSTYSVSAKLFDLNGPKPKVYLTLGCLAVLGHSLLLGQTIFTRAEVDFSLINVISLVAFIISFSVTFISIRFKANLILPVVYTFSALLLLALVVMPANSHMAIDASDLSLVLHITLALMAYGILVIATLYAFQVNFINFKLKSKNLTAVNHLPPLMQVEGQLFAIMAAGTACLIASQLVGFIFIDGFIATDNLHKTLLSIMAMVIYVVILWGHFRLGWRGHRVLILSVIATLVLTLAYFGSRFVKEFLLT